MVARHADVHNPNDILYGRLPGFPLNDRGRQQSELLGRFLEGRPVRAIYASPLLRARQTGEIIATHHPGLKVHLARALLEVKTRHQGEPNSILKQGFSFYQPTRGPDDETMQDVFERLDKFLRKIVRRHAAETVVLVSHGDPIAIARLGLLGEELTVENLHKTVYPQRASVNQVVVQPAVAPEITYFDVTEKI